MKLRTGEFWVATSGYIFSIYTFLNNAFSANKPHESYIREMTDLFAEKGLVYDYGLYHLLPGISVATGLYLAFIFLNNWVFPKYISAGKWNLIVLFTVVTFVFITTTFATYYRYEHFLDYPSFGECFINSIPPVFQIFLVFTAYTIVKNFLVSYLINESSKQTLRARIIREFIAVFIIWLIVLFVLLANDSGHLVPFWICMVPGAYLLYMLNLYRLIPEYQKEPERTGNYAGKFAGLIILLCCCSFLLMKATSSGLPFSTFLIVFVVLYGILTAFSWFIYSQNKEQLFQLYSLKTELGKSSADLQFLRSQINPHFLFNILNTLYGTAIQESADRTSEGIQKLGDMMRFMLYENNLDQIPVAREVDYLKDYIHLQNLRLVRSENIKVEVNIAENSCQHSIAPMLLIPFIENAFKHGISLQNRSWIHVSLSCRADKLELDVYNSIHPKIETDPENEQKGIGLDNVKQRLELLYPNQYELTIRTSQLEYFVHLTLNLKN
jgi:two-component system LytT family sensor kinase